MVASLPGAMTGPADTPTPLIVAVVGATATGKSAVAIQVALELGGEVVNADAMQFYRGMDIGTAKVPVSERHAVPHHQLDVLEVNQDASVARFQAEARADIGRIHARGHRAIVAGGSGLYHRALLDEFSFPATDPAVRAALEARAEDEGPGVLHRELAAIDPEAAAKIPPQNTKRVVRALEIVALTGSVASSLPRHTYAAPTVTVGLAAPYEVLDARIDARVDAMWEAGLVEEVRGLQAKGLREGVTARRAVGYAETLRHLDGEWDAATTRALIAQHTRRLARKQAQWFRPDPRVTWIDAPVDAADVPRATAQALAVIRAADAAAT